VLLWFSAPDGRDVRRHESDHNNEDRDRRFRIDRSAQKNCTDENHYRSSHDRHGSDSEVRLVVTHDEVFGAPIVIQYSANHIQWLTRVQSRTTLAYSAASSAFISFSTSSGAV
jgi:hypothetical protein